MTLKMIENIREARTKILKDTGHHSYTGRSEFIEELIVKHGLFKSCPITDRGDRTIAQWAKLPLPQEAKEQFGKLHAAVKAKYPWHSSPKHILIACLAYRARVARIAAKEQEEKQAKAKSSKPAKASGKKGAKAKEITMAK